MIERIPSADTRTFAANVRSSAHCRDVLISPLFPILSLAIYRGCLSAKVLLSTIKLLAKICIGSKKHSSLRPADIISGILNHLPQCYPCHPWRNHDFTVRIESRNVEKRSLENVPGEKFSFKILTPHFLRPMATGSFAPLLTIWTKVAISSCGGILVVSYGHIILAVLKNFRGKFDLDYVVHPLL